MPGRTSRLRHADWAALGTLCLLLALSVTAKVYAYRAAVPGSELVGEAAVVDLGEGVSLSRVDAVRQLVRIASCLAPVLVDFVEPSPHGSDTSLAAPPNPTDRVFYVYRGWTLDGPRAAMWLSGLHFMWRAGAMLGAGGSGVRDELAVKLVVPAGCEASPNAVMAALRTNNPAWH